MFKNQRLQQVVNEIAKVHGGDFLASMPTNTPFDQIYRTVKIDS